MWTPCSWREPLSDYEEGLLNERHRQSSGHMKAFFLSAVSMAVFVMSLSAKLPEVSVGKLTRWANFPSSYMGSVTIDIWTPEELDGSVRYPVVYMHDGQMLYDASQTWNGQAWEVDEVLGKAIEDERLPPAIVVGIHNSGANRWGDYFPLKVWESLPDAFRHGVVDEGTVPRRYHAADGMRANQYLKFIVEELRPAVAKAFPVDESLEKTTVMGSSMGGLISMYALCEYPDVFGRAACLSTHWIGMTPMKSNPIPEAFVRYLEAHLPEPGPHRIYFDHGTETLDAHYGVWQKQVDSVMRAKGFDSSNWVTKVFEGTDHSEAAWASRLSIPFEFLLEE